MAPTRRSSYTHEFKLMVIASAERVGNREAARQHGCSEKGVRDWRRMEASIRAAPRQHRAVSSRGAQWPAIDDAVSNYIDSRRQNGLGVSRALIRLEALKTAEKLNITPFKASDGWCTRFLRRNNYSLRRPTKIAQKLGKDYANKLTKFQRFVIKKRQQNNYQLQCIGNMDETPVYMDMLPHSTYNKKGEKTVLIKSTGHEKSRFTTVLAVMADGTKLPPMLIFKRKTKPPGTFPPGIIVHQHEKGWMDEAGTKLWLEKVWQRRPGGLRRRKALLVWDSFKAHLTEDVTRSVEATNTDIAVIPGGLTGILQPLDVSINKPFKDGLRRRWVEWMAAEQYTFTAGGNMRAPPLITLAQWVKDTWDELNVPVITRSFKKCCISNALDGTEDDLVWEDRDREDPNDSEDVDDPGEPSDPYEDEIVPADWETLFGGTNDDDNEE